MLLDNVKYYQLPYIRALVLAPTGRIYCFLKRIQDEFSILGRELLNTTRYTGGAVGKKATERQAL
jgi:hypothetical protein